MGMGEGIHVGAEELEEGWVTYGDVKFAPYELRFMPMEEPLNLMLVVAIMLLLYLIFHLTGVWLRRRGYTVEHPVNMADMLVNIIYLPLICYLATESVLGVDIYDKKSRLFTFRPNSQRLMFLYTIKNIIRTVHVRLFPGSGHGSNPLMMLLHHVVSIAVYGYGCFTPRCHLFAGWDGLCEYSAIPLNVLQMWHAFKLSKTQYPYGILYKINGFFLWLTYAVFRIASFSALIYVLGSDGFFPDEKTGKLAKITFFESYAGLGANVFLLIISCIWFITITKGLLKALLGKRKTEVVKIPSTGGAEDGAVVKAGSKPNNTDPALRQRRKA
mmetsp:Transcript_3050/g.4413  ORF Transcript_3050/g.4413 Transcript_3050/m.4413 type:complete len:328 (+) Transcript_3050:41-1024(+)